MSKTPDYAAQEKAFLMYSAQISAAEIAKELQISVTTLRTWRINGKWDEKISNELTLTDQITDSIDELTAEGLGNDVEAANLAKTIKQTLHDAILVDKIKPRKWKDVLDTITLLSRVKPKKDESSHVAKDITQEEEDTLDQDIQELQQFIGKAKVQEAIVVE